MITDRGKTVVSARVPARAQARVRRVVWVSGWPVRAALVGLLRVYRWVLSPVAGGGCKFYPSCSQYAEGAIRSRGAVIGVGLAVWRVLRCHPWSRGGIDHPPAPRSREARARVAAYERVIQAQEARG